jgi:hypothetical protein
MAYYRSRNKDLLPNSLQRPPKSECAAILSDEKVTIMLMKTKGARPTDSDSLSIDDAKVLQVSCYPTQDRPSCLLYHKTTRSYYTRQSQFQFECCERYHPLLNCRRSISSALWPRISRISKNLTIKKQSSSSLTQSLCSFRLQRNQYTTCVCMQLQGAKSEAEIRIQTAIAPQTPTGKATGSLH